MYVPTIGLEIHAELKTKTKMFCSSKNDANETRPNVNVCPVCLAHPGTLPVINREAVRHVLRVGAALGGRLADYTEFDRKNYFYPDLPKGYQLSQYEYPLVSGGALAGISITRVHLEEDTASSMHSEETGTTTIDYNRAGVPLMELVTEPVIRSAEEAGNFARELQLLLRYLGASDANMEKGEMRVEANVSVGRGSELGTKVEIKNLNSFNAMERAVRYEIQRQSALLEKGGIVVQETLGWDEGKQATFAQRVKEGSADYRYFPDPDLPSLWLAELGLTAESLARELPELPVTRRERYLTLGLRPDDAMLFTSEPLFGDFFDAVVAATDSPDAKLLAANYIANDLVNLVRTRKGVVNIRDEANRDTQNESEIGISARDFAKIVTMATGRKISSRGAKDLIAHCIETGEEPEKAATSMKLLQVSSVEALGAVVDEIIAENGAVVAEVAAGKSSALEFLVGQGMRKTKGAADPAVLRKLLSERVTH